MFTYDFDYSFSLRFSLICYQIVTFNSTLLQNLILCFFMLSLSQFHTNIHIKIKNTKSNNTHEIKEVVCSLINNFFSSFLPSGHLSFSRKKIFFFLRNQNFFFTFYLFFILYLCGNLIFTVFVKKNRIKPAMWSQYRLFSFKFNCT